MRRSLRPRGALTALLSAATFVGTQAGPAPTTRVERIYPRVVRGRAMAIVRATAGIVAVGVSIAAGVVLESFGYGVAFAAAGAVGVVASLAVLAMRVPAAAHAGRAAAARDGDTLGVVDVLAIGYMIGALAILRRVAREHVEARVGEPVAVPLVR